MGHLVRHQTWHLEEADLLPRRTRCPVCLDAGAGKDICVIQRDPEVLFVECLRCMAISASRMPSDELLSRYYESYYTEESDAFQEGTATQGLARHISRYGALLPHREVLRVLDFGGGDGAISRAIGRRMIDDGLCERVEIVIVDVATGQEDDAENASASNDHQVQSRKAARLSEVDGPFDFILASAVLEHVPDLKGTLDGLVKAADAGSVLYSRTPFLTPFAAVSKRIDFGFPGHVHDLGAGFWNRFVDTFGLDAELAASGPSPVATRFSHHPLRTMVAHGLKVGARLERLLRGAGYIDPWWRWVGGWEAAVRFRSV